MRSSILVKLEVLEEGKLGNAEKKPWSKTRINNKLTPHVTPGACFSKDPVTLPGISQEK